VNPRVTREPGDSFLFVGRAWDACAEECDAVYAKAMRGAALDYSLSSSEFKEFVRKLNLQARIRYLLIYFCYSYLYYYYYHHYHRVSGEPKCWCHFFY